MIMTLRWFGTGFDSVTLEKIRQIPGVKGVVTTLYATNPGDVWPREEIRALKEEVEAAGLFIAGIESVNIHDAIKIGDAHRDHYIDNYIETLTNLALEGIRMVCYNFMPVFDWTRTDLARVRGDGSTVLAYNQKIVDEIRPDALFSAVDQKSNGFILPGWEPERLKNVQELFRLYQSVDEETLFENLCYFLQRIMPVCDRYDINMAIHPDDPAWPVFDLPRIITGEHKIMRLLRAVDNPHNGVTLCTGSLGSSPKNDIPKIIHALRGRIHFAHVRNLRYNTPDDFEEAAHLSSDGSLDLYEIMKALYDTGFNGPVRPDHGRMIWGEVGMPGYGLYDRALGACYLNGLWEAIDKNARARQREET